MDSNLTDITVILDRSGSMAATLEPTISGFNAFLKKQKEAEGRATFTLVKFDSIYEVAHDGLNIQKVPELDTRTFVPRGMTALYDAMGEAINTTGARLAKMPEQDRPGKVIVVIITDGMENASCKYSLSNINEMITIQRDVYNWEFVFIGANQDALRAAEQCGISRGAAMTYAHNAKGTEGMFASLGEKTVSYRSGDLAKGADFFDADDRKKQTDAGA